MGQQAVVTLNTVAYSPAGSNGGIVTWVNRSGGVSASFSKLTQGYATQSGARQVTKATYRLAIPVVATADSTCSCAGSLLRTSSAQIDFWIDPNSTLAERTDLFLRIKDLAASTLLSDGVENLDPAFA